MKTAKNIQTQSAGRREKKRDATRTRLLETAFQLFREKGYDATTVDDIVLAADFVKGTFYYHFESKESIVFALLFDEIRILVERVTKQLAERELTAVQILDNFQLHVATWTRANPQVSLAILKLMDTPLAHLRDDAPIFDPDWSYLHMMKAIFERGQEEGTIRKDVDVNELIATFIVLQRQMRREVLAHPRVALRKHVSTWTSLLLSGIGCS